jgi:integrase
LDALTATAIRNAKPADKVQRLFDGRGLYLEIMPSGARYWRLKYRHAGKEKRLALGFYPIVSLTDARRQRDAAREGLREGRDPSADLRGALAPVVSKPHAAITDPAKVGELLRALDDYAGQLATRCALRLAPLLFVRPGELRHAEWAEFDLDAAEWRIPAHKMKMREAHVVPLPTQAIAILRELHPLTGRGRYLFPGLRTIALPMSENTVNAALRRLGYDKDTMTGHGFRAMASTRLNEMGWAPDVIERQLAHAERNKVRAAYNRAQYMAERRKMMQAWADYLDGLRTGGKVIAFKRKAK